MDPEGLKNLRPYGSGNSQQRRFDRRHPPSRPNIPKISRDNIDEAAGYYDEDGQYYCIRWRCGPDKSGCTVNDPMGNGNRRMSDDFLPEATNPNKPPSGCTCDEPRFRTVHNAPELDVGDIIDLGVKLKRR